MSSTNPKSRQWAVDKASRAVRACLHTVMAAIVVLVIAGWTGPVLAEDPPSTDGPAIHLLLGGQNDVGGGTTALKQHTSAWEGIYEQPKLIGDFGLQLRYLNEGYLGPTNVPWAVRLNETLNYRDSYGVQFNYWSPFFGRCRAGSALGPEIYFDTFARAYRAAYEDRHGIGMHLNVAAQCRLSTHWSAEIIASRSFDIASFDSSSIVLGLSYSPSWILGDSQAQPSTGSRYFELTAGRSEVDSFHMMGEVGSIVWATYGQRLRDPLALEVSLVNEDVSGIFQRRGLSTQLVAHHDLFSNHVQLFVGVGPEFTRYHDDVAQTVSTQVNLLLSYGIRAPIGDRLSLVLRFGRLESACAKNDADLLSAGFAIKL
jgi:hypothetical protein